jgi:UDP-N-acetylglucosamine 4-epimerase
MLDSFRKYIEGKTFLVTGGAGFIGSNIIEFLLKNNAQQVTCLDNLSTGYQENVDRFSDFKNYSFINGDIRDLATCKAAVEGQDYVLHQAALGSVPRSIKNPILTNEVNVSGFLNMLVAAKDCKTLERFVYAASSSTFGDNVDLPKVEGSEGKPLSPYAVTKAVNEHYANVFSSIYGFHTIGLRYFNVFGPHQNPDNPYAAVVPIFCKAFINKAPLFINGDGETSRDFTYVDNAICANMKALFSSNVTKHEVYNVACGEATSLNQMVTMLQEISGESLMPEHKEERLGDVKHSMASIDKISSKLGYNPQVQFKEGLMKVYNWYKENKQN